MKYYTFNDPIDTTVNPIVNRLTTLSEAVILEKYWVYWSTGMIERLYNPLMNHITKDMITIDRCIQDWVVIHWAWETDEKGNPIK